MEEFFYGFLIGFGSCLALVLGWYHGSLRPRLDALKTMAADSLRAHL